MTDQTARFALPLIDPGQSQKEMTHNEALASIDAALQPSVRGVGEDTPPATPAIGEQWIVGSAPTDAWAGRADVIATWTAGGWRFVTATEGALAWSLADALPVRFTEGKWAIGAVAARRLMIGGTPVVGARQPAIAAPAGGAAIDVEARASIGAILTALVNHGLIAEN